ncbi:MAG: Coenzyme F420 hydrogenase/dehydrogenase, beta subunit C-terminal domain [Clostridiaceae bacterium]
MPINFNFSQNCCGCHACVSICPNNAITMEIDNEGFSMPVIDKSLCTECNLCNIVCPHENISKENKFNDDDVCFCAYPKNIDEYKTYTSAGVFSVLAQSVLEDGGKVCGCVWDNNMVARHVLTNDVNLVKKMSKSKYVQSDTSGIYGEVKKNLQLGTKVLFSGTPCQVAGLKCFLQKQYDNLITCAIVCHGTPSPAIWNAYKEWLENKHNSKMIDANFRYKDKYGWISPYSKYDFENNKSLKLLSFTDDMYVIAFAADFFHRNSCYNCHYKCTNSDADLIIGDFWGCSQKLLEYSKNRGISAIIIHSKLGQEAWNGISNKFNTEKLTFEQIYRENLPMIRPVRYKKSRELVFQKFRNNDPIEKILMLANNRNIKIKKVLYKLHVFEFLKRYKYKRSH